ncbi:MAG TPA: efflux RND transporter permease subunit, partial [Candidatus Sumerlaeota bacterium]|nr:efflux RND transporter permease subunit [Candidatus Sumerlaeota bacterium]
ANVAKGFNSPQVLAEVRQVAEKGRVRILPRDIKDQARFLALIRDGGDDTAKLIQKHLKPATLQKLTGSVLAEDDQGDTLNQVLSDLNLALARRNGLDREALSSALPDLVAPAGEPIPLPQGYTISYTGENEEQEKAQAYISKAFVMAILLIAFVLVTQFNSVLTPIIIMTSVILSLIGVFLGLMVTNHSFGIIMTGMGVISLAGVVVNNAIVLIDYTNLLRRQGMACREAIVTACCTRFRPVLLTAVTTMLGMIPMAIGISYNFHAMRWEVASEMSQYWGSMASAVIFGLAVATALTLFVVPNIYSLIFERRRAAVPE